ncbi:MAG: hypothetical protein KF694_01825 [Mesorhizobium sp.]|nr:hypothetical protein [Mesorhizobium sp.]
MTIEETSELMKGIAVVMREFVDRELRPIIERLDKLEATVREAKAHPRVRVAAGRSDNNAL